MELKSDLARAYVDTVSRQHGIGGTALQVWLACFDAFEMHVRTEPIVLLGLQRLVDWWKTVEQRDRLDTAASNLLDVQLGRLGKMSSALQSFRGGDLARHITETRTLLEERREKYFSLDGD